MPKLLAKPWNDPWTRAAERDPAYRSYCFGTRAARDASWRRCVKAHRKLESSSQPAGRIERAILRVARDRAEFAF